MKTTKNSFLGFLYNIPKISTIWIVLSGLCLTNPLYATCPGSISITGQTSICAGNSTQLSAFCGYAVGVYRWIDMSTNQIVASGSTVALKPSTTTTYMVSVKDTGACSYTEYVKITVNSIPIASLSVPKSAKVGEKVTATVVYGSTTNTVTYTKPPLNNVGGTGFQGGFAEWGNAISSGYFALKVTNTAGCSKTIYSYLNVVN